MNGVSWQTERASGPMGIVAVVGPTATGKSDLAMGVATQIGAEIVNADAMQLYRGMDLGTAKATPDERHRIRHHCLDLLDVSESASLARFQALARAAVFDIQRRGRVALVVGGSALYVRALCDELDIPPRDPAVRRRLLGEAERLGAAQMHSRLAALDPQAAAQIDPRNPRRVVRALEVVELTGSFTARMPDPVPWRPTLWLAVRWPRSVLDRRIDARTRRMFAAGLVDETRDLLAKGLTVGQTAAKAVGYSQAVSVVNGDLSLSEAVEDTIAATRRLARRQERVFRADPRVQWLSGEDLDHVAAAVRLATEWLSRP